MIIECFFENIYLQDGLELKLCGFRHGWKKDCSNKPNKHNIYKILPEDFNKLIGVIDNVCILSDELDYNFNSGNLYLKVIDNKKNNTEKGDFISSL